MGSGNDEDGLVQVVNGFAGAFGIAWASKSYEYDWLKVGAGASALKEFWIAASGVARCLALGIWLDANIPVAAQGRRRLLSDPKTTATGRSRT
jgi:hypothetical protein